MTYSNPSFNLFLAILICIFFLYPEDCIIFAGLVKGWLQVYILNYYLMFQAWMMYRQIKADMAKMGLPVPPFHFVPIWQRPPHQRKP